MRRILPHGGLELSADSSLMGSIQTTERHMDREG
jgi:hypothetical protein